MNRKRLGPKWWQLFLIFPVLAGFAWFDARLQVSLVEHQAIQLAVLFAVAAFVRGWVRSNTAALAYMDDATYRRSTAEISMPLQRRIFLLPAHDAADIAADSTDGTPIDLDLCVSPEVPSGLGRDR